MLSLREQELKARHRIEEVMVELHPTLLGIERVVIIFLVGRWMVKVFLKRKFTQFFTISLIDFTIMVVPSLTS